jgi:prepilin-type N-terminal cleavage/methylation domain-containing protein
MGLAANLAAQVEMAKISLRSSTGDRKGRAMRRLQRNRSGARGFTLTELLVVIGILGILAALLFPVLAKARRDAGMTACLSNLHQVGLAIRMYQADWGPNLPRDAYDPSQPKRSQMYLLQPYLHNQAVTKCPSGWMPSPEYRYHWSPVPRTVLQPRSGTVVAFCMEHLEQFTNPDGRGFSLEKGLYTVVREDASASKVLASKVELWNYQAGRWIRNNGRSYAVGTTGAWM